MYKENNSKKEEKKKRKKKKKIRRRRKEKEISKDVERWRAPTSTPSPPLKRKKKLTPNLKKLERMEEK